MKNTIFIFLMCMASHSFGQLVSDLPSRYPTSPVESITVEQIATDSLCTSFLMWIRSGVQHHFHAEHTESIYFIEGSGVMQMADSAFSVKAGDFVMVPKGTPHSLIANVPVKVLSIQAPMWVKDDRIFVEPTRRPHNE